MKQILVFNVNWVGDVIFASPIFRALKAKYPQARVVCLAVPRVKDILQCCPGLDEVIEYDEKGRHRGLWAKLKLIWRLRKQKFDVVFLLHRSWTRALLVFLAGIPVRVGYDTKKRGPLLTHKVEPLCDQPHRSEHYCHVIESFGIPVEDTSCVLAAPQEVDQRVEEVLKQNGVDLKQPVVIVNPGGNWDLKRWPKERFAQLIKGIRERWDVQIILSGAPKDVSLVQHINDLSGKEAVLLAGKTSLKELVALLGKSVLVVSADSGPLHIASGVGTPVVALFGPTRPQITGPRGSGRAVLLQKDVGCNKEACYALDCSDNVCMKAVTVEDAMAAADTILKEQCSQRKKKA